MTKPLRASVIVDNYNYAKFLGDAVDSALAQTYPYVEVIVVDDGSTDNSRDVITGYGNRVISVFKENGGQASAFNAGFEISRGDIVLFLDSDDLLLPTAVEKAVVGMQNPGVIQVQWHMWEIDETGAKLGNLIPSGPLAAGDFRAEVIRSGPTSAPYPPTSGNAWRRSFLSTVLPVPEYGDKHGADAYLCVLAPLYGLLHALPEPQGCYRVHPRSFSTGHGKLGDWCRDCSSELRLAVSRYKNHCKALAQELRHMGIEADTASWMGPQRGYAWMTDMLSLPDALVQVIPEGATFLFIEENTLGGRFVSNRKALPFMERDGAYWGLPPDGATAAAEVRRLCRSGAEFLVIIRSCFWWLEAYPELDELLRAKCSRILDDHRAIVFDLRALVSNGS